uniref:Uncharacterized protein n=1 Tax=Corvus moneduloides TaxID=1196302 RepID=A0A8C3EKQ0_CORMO
NLGNSDVLDLASSLTSVATKQGQRCFSVKVNTFCFYLGLRTHNFLHSTSRLTGFYLSVIILICLITLGEAGTVSSFLDEYLDFSIMEKVHKLL